MPGRTAPIQPHDAERYRAPALDKGLDILELLASRDGAMSQVEIAKSLDRSAGEIFRMLDRLVRRGYVQRTEEDRYALTLKLFELAHATPPLGRLLAAAMPLMREFAAEVRQACHLVTWDGERLVVVAQVDAPGYWSLAIRVGAQVDLLETGSGLVFLANADPAERARLLAVHGGPETNRAFLQVLESVRIEGCAKLPSRQIAAVTSLAVPVHGGSGSVIAAIACPFVERLDAGDAPDADGVIAVLKKAAARLSTPQA